MWRVPVRALSGARADIRDVILERSSTLNLMVAAVQTRGEAGDGTDGEHEHQSLASHGSAKAPEAAPEWTGLDEVSQDFALPLIQRFVHLAERI